MNARFRKTADSQSGFSLIEVLLAMFVLGSTVLAFGAMELQTVDLAARNAATSPTSAAASGKLEELTRLPYAQVVSGSDRTALADGTVIYRKWHVAVDEPVVGAKTVTLMAQMQGVEAVRAVLATVLTEIGGSP